MSIGGSVRAAHVDDGRCVTMICFREEYYDLLDLLPETSPLDGLDVCGSSSNGILGRMYEVIRDRCHCISSDFVLTSMTTTFTPPQDSHP